MANGNKTRGQLRSPVVRFHRWVGLVSFFVLTAIAATGVVLNHSSDLDLDGRVTEKGWLMRWYGMEPEGEPVAFQAGGHRIAGWDGSFFFDEDLFEAGGELVGAVVWGEEIAVVCREDLYLLDQGGVLVEKVLGAMLPEEAIEQAGLTAEGCLALLAGGRPRIYRDRIFEELDYEGREIAWARRSAIAEEERLALARLHRGEGLPLYRVILDLHSGKFFGTAGVVVYDLAAVSVVLLSATGLWLAVRNFYRSGRSNRRE